MRNLKLIVGLGNPGPSYLDTRHNAGQAFVEAIANNRKRSSIDLARYQEMYGLNPEDRTPYTHVIDASNLDTQGVLDATMEILEGIE